MTASRRRIEKILNGEDKRLLVVIGPCIHDLDAAMDYANGFRACGISISIALRL
jgi:phospho-2-dehydro-3-deoxyheptonate aldolase